MTTAPTYVEETFGILTDDDLYLDCVFVKPAKAADKRIKVIRVWVPKFPLTKSSVITCARQEVGSYGEDGRIANLVFDLRGTGDSDGVPGDQDFHLDLEALADWAEERFGRKTNFGFFGFPISEEGHVYMWPLRPGTVMESYHYPPGGADLNPPTLLYLSSYGNFRRSDDMLCTSLARAGYDVYGVDPFRYLLHASASQRLMPEMLTEDLHLLIQMLPNEPIVIAQPLAAGLALYWASQSQQIRGTIAIGRAQSGLAPAHVFDNSEHHAFALPRYLPDISPRPVVLVQHVNNPMGSTEERMKALFECSQEPHRLERVRDISPKFLLDMVRWIEEYSEQTVTESEEEK